MFNPYVPELQEVNTVIAEQVLLGPRHPQECEGEINDILCTDTHVSSLFLIHECKRV